MKKWIKRTLAAVLSGVLLLSGANTAWATATQATQDSTTKLNYDTVHTVGDVVAANDTSSFVLTKDYQNSTNAPEETFNYTITRYAVWNADGTYPSGVNESRTDIPILSGTMSNSKTTPTTTITLPAYTVVGDYWYKIVETNNHTTGVIYGTNDGQTENLASANGAHNATYYIHVQVTQGSSALVRNVTIHKTAPSGANDADYNSGYGSTTAGTTKYSSADKVKAIQNKYYAGQLSVTKNVAGNAGDTSEYFKVRVIFTKPAGTIINSDITFTAAITDNGTSTTTSNITIKGQYYSGTGDTTNLVWKEGSNKAASNSTNEATATAEFYIKHGETVTFSNVPYGINYTVEEYTTGDLGYTNSFTNNNSGNQVDVGFNGNSPALTTDAVEDGHHFYDDTTPDVGARGSITSATADVVTITNTKNTPIDIGVITEDAPFFAMLAVAGVAAVLLVVGKRKNTEV